MKVIKDRRDAAETEHAEKGAFGRRSILGGIAAVPVLYGIGAATSAQAATVTRPGSAPATDSGLVPTPDSLTRGAEQRYNAPLLAPGTRLVLPEGIRATTVQGYYRRPHLASAETA